MSGVDALAEGFYWVLMRTGEWSVAQVDFIGDSDDEKGDASAWSWSAIGSEEPWALEDFAEIGPRIEPPDDRSPLLPEDGLLNVLEEKPPSTDPIIWGKKK